MRPLVIIAIALTLLGAYQSYHERMNYLDDLNKQIKIGSWKKVKDEAQVSLNPFDWFFKNTKREMIYVKNLRFRSFNYYTVNVLSVDTDTFFLQKSALTRNGNYFLINSNSLDNHKVKVDDAREHQLESSFVDYWIKDNY